jgi:hypothetical protein
MRTAKNKHEKGYTLLEYCAGAAIVLSVVFGSLTAVRTHLTQFLGKVGEWAKDFNVTTGKPDGN